MLERIVKDAVSELADFVRCYESVFLYLQAQKHSEFEKNQVKKLKATIESSKKRISDLVINYICLFDYLFISS